MATLRPISQRGSAQILVYLQDEQREAGLFSGHSHLGGLFSFSSSVVKSFGMFNSYVEILHSCSLVIL